MAPETSPNNTSRLMIKTWIHGQLLSLLYSRNMSETQRKSNLPAPSEQSSTEQTAKQSILYAGHRGKMVSPGKKQRLYKSCSSAQHRCKQSGLELNSLRPLLLASLLLLLYIYLGKIIAGCVSFAREESRAGAAMAVGMKGLLVLTLGLAMAATSSAVIYKVGDTSGWTILGNVNYSDWATKKTFHVGDTIEFHYPQGIHNVLEVKKADYDSCTNSTPIATHTSGDDKIVIKSPGHRFFICGVPGHCAAGQKVNIRVLKPQTSHAPSKAPAPAPARSAASPSGSGEPSAASPPAASSTDSTPDTPTTTAPAPNANGAAVTAGYRAVVAMALAAVASMAMLQ